MSNIIDIHIKRTAAGSTIPFDKIYLVHRDDFNVIPKLFEYALVLPFDAQVKRSLRRIVPEMLTRKGFKRNDEEKNQEIPDVKHIASAKVWWDAFFKEHRCDERAVVIPILTRSIRKKILPLYMTAREWPTTVARAQRTRSITIPVLNEFAYLSTPKEAPYDKIRPICSICPRMLLHMQGECKPGELVCYKSLDFSEINKSEPSVEPDASVSSDSDSHH